jgi:hypothetical protein
VAVAVAETNEAVAEVPEVWPTALSRLRQALTTQLLSGSVVPEELQDPRLAAREALAGLCQAQAFSVMVVSLTLAVVAVVAHLEFPVHVATTQALAVVVAALTSMATMRRAEQIMQQAALPVPRAWVPLPRQATVRATAVVAVVQEAWVSPVAQELPLKNR